MVKNTKACCILKCLIRSGAPKAAINKQRGICNNTGGTSPESYGISSTLDSSSCPTDYCTTDNSGNYDCSGVNFPNRDFSSCDLKALNSADFTGTDLSGAIFTGLILDYANFTGANLTDANFGPTNDDIDTFASYANFTDANLTDADFTDAALSNAIFTNATLTGANLTNAYTEYLDASGLYGVISGRITGKPRGGLPLYWELIDGYLIGPSANLTGARLILADLTDADLTFATLTDADLTGADLTGADLTFATLTDADLTGADLTGANLTGATLTDVISGGIIGNPTALPSDWELVDGTLQKS